MVSVGSLAAAYVAGYLARRLRVPGGAIVGALVVTAVLSVQLGDITVAQPLRVLLFTGVGTMIGSRVDRASIRALPGIAMQATVAAVLIILAGLGISLLLRWWGMAPEGDMLATSPGALSVLAAAALENGLDAPTVSLFHITRIILILVTLPFLVLLLPGRRGRSGGIEAVPTEATDPTAGDPPSSDGPSTPDIGWLLATLAGAGIGGSLATWLGIPGPLIFGTVTGAAIVTLSTRRDVYRPSWLAYVIQCGLGWIIGSLVTADTLVTLGEATLPALVSAVLIILAGILIALSFRLLGIAPEGDVLATSPGAVEALASLAAEQDAGPLQVAVFHTVRLILVIGSLPLLLQWS